MSLLTFAVRVHMRSPSTGAAPSPARGYRIAAQGPGVTLAQTAEFPPAARNAQSAERRNRRGGAVSTVGSMLVVGGGMVAAWPPPIWGSTAASVG